MRNFSKYRTIIVSFMLLALVFAAFEPLRHNDFIDFDDSTYIVDNSHIRSGLTLESIGWAFTSGYAGNWHPLTWISHMVDIELFNLEPVGHHLHSLILHALATVLLFLLLYKMTGSFWCSAFAAVVFGIHPLRVESVAWASERKDVLSALLWMLTIAAYLFYVSRTNVFRYLLVLFCFALGLMAKPMLVTLPIILLIIDFGLLKNTRRSIWRWAILEKTPLLVLALAACVITYKVQQMGGSVTNLNVLPWAHRVSNAMTSYIAYLGKIFWPVDLALLYPYPLQWDAWKPVVALLLLLLLSAYAVFRFAREPYLASGWLWYLVSLVPVIGIVQVGAQAMADRYTYLPSIGIAVMLAWAVSRLTLNWPYRRTILAIVCSITLGAMIVQTRVQLAYWKDSFAIFQHTINVTRNNAIMHNYLGQTLLKQGQFEAAEPHIAEALKIRPAYGDAYANMGMIRNAQGRMDEAVRAYEQAIELEPSSLAAYTNLGTLKASQGLVDEAVHYLSQSVQINPTSEACFNLGMVLQMQGRTEEAISYHRLALSMAPDDYQIMWHLAVGLYATGDFEEAAVTLRRILQIVPNFPEALSKLAWILATVSDNNLRNPEEAIVLAQQACQMMEYEHPDLLDTLAAAYASAGRYEEAVQTVRRAIDLVKQSGPVEMAQDFEKRMELYQHSQAYTLSP